MGGMTKAVASGMPKLRIEETAARRQADIDRGDQVIVGVNKYRLEKEDEIDILDVDNVAVREAQIARLENIRSTRDQAKCEAALAELSRRAAEGGNLLEAAVEAARARASVGEISMAMENVFGRHRAEVKTLAGVYGAAYEGDEDFAAIQKSVESFAEEEGRRPRMLVVKMGQDGHDRGAKVIATAFADIGFDVDVGPLFQTPEEAVLDAIDNDVHVIGISSQAAGHKTLAPRLIEVLKERDAGDVLVICGGVIPQQDYDFLKSAGVKAIFGPGTNIPNAAQEILDLIRRDADRVAVGKSKGNHSVPQEEIHEMLIRSARQGRRVVRLKGGDPFIFGRGGEELEAVQAAGIEAFVVPGISSALGCAAQAGVPLTHRDHAHSLTFVTGHASKGGVPDLDWEGLARPNQTVTVFMGVGTASVIADKLIEAGRAPDTPVAVIENGTLRNEIQVFGILAELPDLITGNEIKGPALLIIGEVAGLPFASGTIGLTGGYTQEAFA